jgi:hypothetical protein
MVIYKFILSITVVEFTSSPPSEDSIIEFIEESGYSSFTKDLLPPELAATIEGMGLAGYSLVDYLSEVKNFFKSVKILRSLGRERLMQSVTEIHRPRVDGCKSTYKQTSKKSNDFSISVKVFGFGGGVAKKREYAITEEVECTGKCLKMEVPIEVEWQECKSLDWKGSVFSPKGLDESDDRKNIFVRCNILEIHDDLILKEIDDTIDECQKYTFSHIKNNLSSLRMSLHDLASKYRGGYSNPKDVEDKINFIDDNYYVKNHVFTREIPTATAITKNLSIRNGVVIECSLQGSIMGLEFGPKALIEYTKDVEFSYVLKGPHNYIGWTTGGEKNGLGYSWTWE